MTDFVLEALKQAKSLFEKRAERSEIQLTATDESALTKPYIAQP